MSVSNILYNNWVKESSLKYYVIYVLEVCLDPTSEYIEGYETIVPVDY